MNIHATRAAAYRVAVDGDAFRYVDANDAALAMSGFVTAFQPGLTPQDIFPAEMAAAIVARYRACCAGGAISYACHTMNGEAVRQWRTTLVPIAGADGGTASIVGICSPLEEPADHSTLALEALDGGFWTLDLATRDFRTSRGLAEKIAGPGRLSLDMAEYVGHVHAGDLSLEMPDGDSDVVLEFRVYTYEGRERWLRTRRRPIRDASGRATHVVGIVMDITDQKTAMMRLAKEAVTDKLTHVPNRRAFERAAERCFGNDAMRRFGIMLIDLDNFKPVNDRHGHLVGDELLREVGRRLAPMERPGDLLARFGGDEFALLLPDTTPEALDRLAARIDAAFLAPFQIGGLTISIGASCGGAFIGAQDQSVGDIVARADRALYAVKDRRRRLTA